MKTKKFQFAGACLIAVLVTVSAMAQQQKRVLPYNPAQKEITANNDAGSFSFKLYNAPNDVFGYDIYKNGKPVYHQFVLMFISKEGKRVFATKPQAEKAALLAIAKIKQGQLPAISAEELKKIVAL